MKRVSIPGDGKERVRGVPTSPIRRASFHGIEDAEKILGYKCVLKYITQDDLVYINTLKNNDREKYTTIVDNLNLMCYKDKYFDMYPPLQYPQSQELYDRLTRLNSETDEYVGILEQIYTYIKQLEHRSEQEGFKKNARDMGSIIRGLENKVVHDPKVWDMTDTTGTRNIKIPGLTQKQEEELREQAVPDGPDILAALNTNTMWGDHKLDDRMYYGGRSGVRKTKQRKPKQRKTKRGTCSSNFFSKYLKGGKNTKRKRRMHK